MDIILATLSFTQILILLILILATVIGLAIFILTKTPLKFRRRDGSILSINELEKIEKSKIALKEEVSLQKKDLLITIEKVSELTNKQIEIRRVDTLNYQMTYAEDKLSDVRTFFDTKFIELLRKKLDTDDWQNIPNNKDFRVYSLIIKGALDKIASSFRNACRVNHFDEYEEHKFFGYAERKAISFIKIINEAIQDNYTFGEMVSQEDVLKCHEKDLYPKVKEGIISMFSNARKHSIDSYQKVYELETVLIDFVRNYLGIELSQEEKELFAKSFNFESVNEIRKFIVDKH